MECKAIKIAHYNFEGKNGKEVNTSKLLVSLGFYGTITLCTNLANDVDLLDELVVNLEVNDRNNFVVKSIEK